MLRGIRVKVAKGRRAAGVAAAAALLLSVASIRAARAQTTWNDARTRALVERAVDLRARQLADTGLIDYRADAHGYLTFLAQVGQGFTEPPRIVKADELALEVYWRAPNLSKQRIIGRRDTLLLPTDIAYHRDHLGIIQNNFPSFIRLGEGDEVRDVPHPLSPLGLREYDFAISDSLGIQLPGRTIQVYQVKVRPKDDRLPRVIGAVYIDQSEAQVVRVAFSFTRAAFIDKELEDLSIVLENGLVGTRFWLPRRQEIEIRRTGSWLDYPVRGIIRGRWEISNYRINEGVPPSIFNGPEIVQAPPAEQKAYRWATRRLLDSLPPDVRAVSDADVQRVQAEARALVREQALQRARTLALSARSASDFVRVNRVEGLALGAGLTQRIGGGMSVGGRVRYGIDDRVAKWQGQLQWESGAGASARGYVLRDFRDVADVPERSGMLNSLASQEFGSDATDPYGVVGGGIGVALARPGRIAWRADASYERASALGVHSQSVAGDFRPTVAARGRDYVRLALRAERPASLWFLGTELDARLELRGMQSVGVHASCPLGASGCFPDASFSSARFAIDADLERPIGTQRLVLRTVAAAVGGRGDRIPPQELVYFGGPVTAPGYDLHELVARAAVSQRVEWRTRVPFVAIPLGRFGRIPASATFAPYASIVLLRPPSAGQPVWTAPYGAPRVAGGYPSLGAGLLTFYDLVRFDVARGLRDGRWRFNVDVSAAFWDVL